ncbi:hypothetical protein J7337_009269 [Fusarium musae]|uniref:Uncharacterized protein n=1 Tax=Fusarium musae TaxID=1042133 RepID=A0A9P8DAS7_9HYPO|nr:hypothetical protein J7337_009269 [Fusarium musae]KAG9498464.1 hypothetical protein J7337_009269 [Fusarium musae]
MSTKMLSELHDFLTLFVERVPEDKPQARFGHIQMPPYRLGGRMANLGDDWAFNHPDWALSGWHEHKVIPTNIVLVLCLNPQVPSACALSLVGVVKWAIQMSLMESDIRVLTMPAEEDFNFLSKIVSFTASGVNVASLNLAAHGQVDPIQHCKCPGTSDVNMYAEGVLGCMQNKPERRRLIVSFNAEFSKALETKMTKDDRKLMKTVYMDTATTIQPLVELEAGGFKTYFLTIRGELSSLPQTSLLLVYVAYCLVDLFRCLPTL